MPEEKTTEETVAEVQQMFAEEAKSGEPVAPEYTPPEAQTEAQPKGDEKAVTPEPEAAPLFAGKYKTTEEMVTAYQELQTAHNTQTAKVAEQEGALGVAAKDRESHQKFLDVMANADPENVQAAILQHLKESGQVAFDANVLDPKVGLHIASVLNPIMQRFDTALAKMEAGKNAEVEAEEKADYEKEYPFMADADVQKTLSAVADKLRAESADGQIDGDKLIAETAKVVRAATLKEVAAKAAIDSRTGTDPAASAERASDPKPAKSKAQNLVDGIFGNEKEGIAAGGEMPPDHT